VTAGSRGPAVTDNWATIVKKRGIYIHIPFCKRGCFYCHFVKRQYETSLMERYIKALVKEIQIKANPDVSVDTVYIGGGSPSLLSKKQLTAIFAALHRNFKLTHDTELTAEMNPEDVTDEKLAYFKEAGINRLSLGTQSFIPKDLEYLKRTHDAAQSAKAVEKALDTGFHNINIDYIISLLTQTETTIEKNLSLLNQYNIPHISAYILEEVEEGEQKDERDNRLFFFTQEKLIEMGYEHYEVSNYAKPGKRSRHNLKYWHNEDYIGLGLSASGYEYGEDYKNTEDLEEYFDLTSRGKAPSSETTQVNRDLRRIVMGLRLSDGLPRRYFSAFQKELDFLLSNGMLQQCGDNIAVNPSQILLLNEILTYFFEN